MGVLYFLCYFVFRGKGFVCLLCVCGGRGMIFCLSVLCSFIFSLFL